MRTNGILLLISSAGLAAQAPDVCNPADLFGPYAFQLTGSTDISGTPRPTVSLARIAFGERDSLTGTASATFRGLLLGNPVTGSYQVKSDCSVVWELQDDSGGFQHFSGTLSPDGATVQFRQTDPGGAQHGVMKKLSDTCSSVDLVKRYQFAVWGSTTPMLPGDVARTVSAKGILDIDENGSFQVESDCSVRFRLTLGTPDGRIASTPPLTMRGFLVSGGKEILAFQTDPGSMVAARFIAETK